MSELPILIGNSELFDWNFLFSFRSNITMVSIFVFLYVETYFLSYMFSSFFTKG